MTLRDKLTMRKTERLDVRVPVHLMDRVRQVVIQSEQKATKSDIARAALEEILPKIEEEYGLA